MRIKSFIASTVQEALKSVKREMGDDSIILETRNIEEGDIKSMDGQELVEVVAAEYNNVQSADQNEDQRDDQGVQGGRGNLDSQSPDKNQPDTSPPDQQQSEQYSSVTEHKDIPEHPGHTVIGAMHDKPCDQAKQHPDNIHEYN